jgi:hypothetical protein
VEAPKKRCPRGVTHIDRRRRKRKTRDEGYNSDADVAAADGWDSSSDDEASGPVQARPRSKRQNTTAQQTAPQFQIGDSVYAKWNAGEAWFPGKVEAYDPFDGTYTVEFDDGGWDNVVAANHIRRAP